MRATPILLGCMGAILVASLWPKDKPTELTPRQKRDIVSRMHTEILVGQLLYDLPTMLPPAVSFDLDNGNAAESVCSHEDAHNSIASWELLVNERLAAQNWRTYLSETIPHEAGHLLRCQMGDLNWADHDARWSTIIRELGAEPAEQHHYAL